MRRFHLLATLGFTAVLLLPAYASAQPRARELRVERCPGCTLTRRVVATLGRPDDSVLVVHRSRVARLGSTRYLVGPVSVPGQLAIYRLDGTLERVIGREGGGPTEFSRHLGPVIESTAGSVLVFDPANRRVTHIDSLGNPRMYGRVSGSVFAGASLPDGRLVINAQYRPGDQRGLPLHLIERDRIVRSFGDGGRATGPVLVPTVRIIARASGGNLWFSPNDRYELTLTDSLGRAASVLTRPFASPPPDGSGTLAFFISSIHEDPDGRVWVVSGRRNKPPDLRKHAQVNSGTLQAVFAGLTSTIDVIDPKRGSVIYSQTVNGPPGLFLSDGLAYGYREDVNGNPRIELLSMQFTRPN